MSLVQAVQRQRLTGEGRRVRFALPHVAALLLLLSLLLPYWQVTLFAPQYPGGLRARVYLTRVTGDAQEISTLNHYVGLTNLDELATLERRFAVPMVVVVAAAAAASAAVRRRGPRVLLQLPALLFPLGVAADLAFWLWQMGHSIDPAAPIRIEPFMPAIVGRGKVMQFATTAIFGVGFLAAIAASALLIADVVAFRRRQGGGGRPAARPRGFRGGTGMRGVSIIVLSLLTVLLPATLFPAGAAERSLQARIDAAAPGDEVVVRGVVRGGVVIRKPLRLVGEPGAVIDAGGRGTVVRIDAPNVLLANLTLRNSGADLNTEDAGVFVGAPGAVLQDLRLEDVLFGLNLKRAHDAVVRRVTMAGQALPLSRRGDAIRLWYSDRVALTRVTVRGLRDILIWFSKGPVLYDLDVRGSRYGAHLMYAEDAAIFDSRFEGNAVGGYVMYSTRVRVEGNRFLHHRGATGVGLALKESDDVVVRRNLLSGNHVGLYLDATPRLLDATGAITDNVVAGNGTGLVLLSSTSRQVIAGNVFEANARQVSIAGGREGANTWTRGGRGNYWDDYTGLDVDRDGVGDRPYRARRWFEVLGDRVPEAAFLWGSLAVPAVDFAARLFPYYAPEVLVTDPRPMVARAIPREFQGNGRSAVFAAAALALLIVGLAGGRRAMGVSWTRGGSIA